MHQAKLYLLLDPPGVFSGSAQEGACLARRAARAACIERGAKYGDLVFQIETLASKGGLSQEFVSWAHRTPVIADDGSHPEDRVTSSHEAREAVADTERLLVAIYGVKP